MTSLIVDYARLYEILPYYNQIKSFISFTSPLATNIDNLFSQLYVIMAYTTSTIHIFRYVHLLFLDQRRLAIRIYYTCTIFKTIFC
jgi:hypothetical protein